MQKQVFNGSISKMEGDVLNKKSRHYGTIQHR